MAIPVIGLGAGGHARVLLDILSLDQAYEIIGLLDPDPLLNGKKVEGIPVLGGDEKLAEIHSQGVIHFFVGVGGANSTKLRRLLYFNAVSLGFLPISIIHPSAVISERAILDIGITIMAKAVINAGASIGKNVVINTGSIIEHDCDIKDNVHIATGSVLCGGVNVGNNAHIGAGSVVRQYINIGSNSVVGAGAVVVKDVPPNTTVVGVPAKPLAK